VELEMGNSSYDLDKHPLNHFLATLMAKKERCTYVQSVSIAFHRDMLYRDQVLLRALIELLPCLRIFSFKCDRSIECCGKTRTAARQRIRSHRATFGASLLASKGIILPPCSFNGQGSPILTLSWKNYDFNIPFFVSFVSLHPNIRCLKLPQSLDESLPKMDASVLPNLESVQAQITVVLALLPGRKIQKVKTHFFDLEDDWEDTRTDAYGEVFKEDGLELENIKVFTCERSWTKAERFMPFLIRKMKNIEVLDLSSISQLEILSLSNTSVQLLRLEVRLSEDNAAKFFKMYKDGKQMSNVVWKCETWLADWKKDSYAY
ncbi:hypothetical protein EYR40_007392, partial [Pleurotus pulmonarius]